MDIHNFSKPIHDLERSEILFSGDLVVYQQLPALLQLNQKLDALIKKCLKTKQPTMFFQHQTEKDFNHRLSHLQKTFHQSRLFQELFKNALEQAGVDIGQNYSDRLFLRCVPPLQYSNKYFRGSIGHHRDTWGSNIQSQINWWSPIYPVSEQRTIAFYPDYWYKPVANTSDSWSFETFKKCRKETPRSESINYPYAPQVKEAIENRNQQVVVIEPGDLLCFSSAHLHASVTKCTMLTRFSTEIRTVCLDDILQRRQPPNLDNQGTISRYGWFHRLSDRAKLDIRKHGN